MNDPDPRYCPHMDLNDHRCTSRFALGEVEQLFTYCCGGFHGCALYHRINMEVRFREIVGDNQKGILQKNLVPALMQPTVHGNSYRSRPKTP